jgi:hypothetical protein
MPLLIRLIIIKNYSIFVPNIMLLSHRCSRPHTLEFFKLALYKN